MPHTVIVAHGQPSDPMGAEIALAALAARIDTLCQRVTVHSATLAAPDALETCLDGLPENTAVYPLFMARGWFVTRNLPKRIGSRPVRILDPLGVDPDLPLLVAASLRNALADQGWAAKATVLVIAAHGSGRSPDPARVATEFATVLGQQIPFRSIKTGFVEQAPSISEAASGTGNPALCLPFFACAGGHVSDDVPQGLAHAAFTGHVLPVISELPQVQQHIAKILDQIPLSG